jgi:uncharacterized protein with FMN-binding domain
MSKPRHKVASTFIVIGALAGAFAMTQKITPGFQSLFASSSTPTGSPSSSSTSSAPKDQTVQGDAINYRYGTVQVEVVQKSGKISAINMLQSGATAGRDQAFPSLIQAAIQAQGTSFGNLSGATFTTDAFKQALTSAVTKLK